MDVTAAVNAVLSAHVGSAEIADRIRRTFLESGVSSRVLVRVIADAQRRGLVKPGLLRQLVAIREKIEAVPAVPCHPKSANVEETPRSVISLATAIINLAASEGTGDIVKSCGSAGDQAAFLRRGLLLISESGSFEGTEPAA